MKNKLARNLEKLCGQVGVTGYEQEGGILGFLFKIIKNINPNTRYDTTGNILSVIENTGRTIIFEAHMDEMGFLVGEKDGKIVLFPQGVVRGEKVADDNVFIVGKNIGGRVSISSENDFLFVAEDRSSERNIEVGDIVAFKRSFLRDGNKVMASALDNRIGCSALIELLSLAIKNGSRKRLVFVFSRKEEVDESSFKEIINSYPEAFAVVLDAAYAQPMEFNTNTFDTLIPVLGEGCAIQTKGKDFVVSESGILKIKDIAKKNNIKIQEERAPSGFGKTNLARLQDQGIKHGIVINIPVRSQHRQIATTNLFDANEAIRLISEIVK